MVARPPSGADADLPAGQGTRTKRIVFPACPNVSAAIGPAPPWNTALASCGIIGVNVCSPVGLKSEER
jgi:hypothetical protein